MTGQWSAVKHVMVRNGTQYYTVVKAKQGTYSKLETICILLQLRDGIFGSSRTVTALLLPWPAHLMFGRV